MASADNIALPGPVRIFAAPYAPNSIESPPTDSVAFGASWGGGWVELGYTTTDGATLAFGGEKYEIQTAQEMSPVGGSRTSETAQISATLLETTLANLKRAKGIGTLTQGSSVTSLKSDGDDPAIQYVTIGMEAYAPGSKPGEPKFRRAFLWKAEPEIEAEIVANMQQEQQAPATFVARREANAPAGFGKLWHVVDQTY